MGGWTRVGVRLPHGVLGYPVGPGESAGAVCSGAPPEKQT